MAEQINAFRASDGKLFNTLAEALEWEDEKVWAEKVAQFFASGTAPYAEGTYSSMSKKIIVAWERYKVATPEEPSKVTLHDKLEKLDLTIRTLNCLKAEDIHLIGQLVQCTEQRLLRTPNFGRRCLNEAKEKLAMHGFMLSI